MQKFRRRELGSHNRMEWATGRDRQGLGKRTPYSHGTRVCDVATSFGAQHARPAPGDYYANGAGGSKCVIATAEFFAPARPRILRCSRLHLCQALLSPPPPPTCWLFRCLGLLRCPYKTIRYIHTLVLPLWRILYALLLAHHRPSLH